MNSEIKTNTVTTVHDRNIDTLERLCSFKGELLVKMGEMTASEAIRLAVHKVTRGEETKAQGVFVLAEKLRVTPEDDRQSFRESLKSELIESAKVRALALLPDDAKPAQLERVKKDAENEGVRRFDNLGQTMRAARWMLDNKAKVADSVSVFTVQQANAYLEPAKDGASGAVERESIRKAILPLLGKPGTSQGAIKKAVSDAKARLEKAKTPVDNRTEAQKQSEARTASIARLPEKINVISKDIDGLVAEGVAIGDIRSAALTEAVKALAKLAGVEIK